MFCLMPHVSCLIEWERRNDGISPRGEHYEQVSSATYREKITIKAALVTLGFSALFLTFINSIYYKSALIYAGTTTKVRKQRENI